MSLEFEHEKEINTSPEISKGTENTTNENNEPITDTNLGCENCGSLCVEEEYKLRLCKECRDKLSKRPIPIQIKVVSLVLIVIIIFSLIKFPQSINIGIEYERGLRAEKDKKYLTAIQHYKNVVKEYPNSDKAQVRLYVSYFNDEKINEAYKVYDEIAGTSPENKKMDNELVDEVNETTSKLDTYYSPSKDLYDKLKNQQNAKIEDIVNTLKPIVDKDSNEVYAAYYLADLYFDMKNYTGASQVLSKVLTNYPDFYSGYLLQAATYREVGKYDEAVECANKVLKHNVEDTGAYVTLSKIELKRRNNVKGLEYAKKAYEIDDQDPYVIANLALAYHFNNLFSERDKYYKIYKDLNIGDNYTDNLLNSIFNGTLQWQKQI